MAGARCFVPRTPSSQGQQHARSRDSHCSVLAARPCYRGGGSRGRSALSRQCVGMDLVGFLSFGESGRLRRSGSAWPQLLSVILACFPRHVSWRCLSRCSSALPGRGVSPVHITAWVSGRSLCCARLHGFESHKV